MIREIFKIIKKYSAIPVVIAIYTLIFTLYLWITDSKKFLLIASSMYLTVFIIMLFIMLFIIKRELRRKKAFMEYIDSPDDKSEERLLYLCSEADMDAISAMIDMIRRKDYENKELNAKKTDYEEYVENWAHEIKIPLALLAMIIDNHSDKLPGQITDKLDYIRKQIKEYVEQMMLCSKINCGRKDYFFENVDIKDCIDEIIEDSTAMLDEKGVIVKTNISNGTVFTDKRGIKYIISQAISNSVKYAKDSDVIPEISITFRKNMPKNGKNDTNITHNKEMNLVDIIEIKDNGIGVKETELPFIFEKGFTGNSGNARKHATGMGLYIVKKISDDLNINIDVTSKWQHGFEMKIEIPIIKTLKPL